MRTDFVTHAAAHNVFTQQRSTVLVQLVQSRLHAACVCWREQHADSRPQGASCVLTEQHVAMPLVGMSCSGQLLLPTVTCATCLSSFQPSAVQVGRFPSSPVDPHRWYDMELLQLFKLLSLQEGLNATGDWWCWRAHALP